MDTMFTELPAQVKTTESVKTKQDRPINPRPAGLSNVYQVLGIAELAQDTNEYGCHYRVVRSSETIFRLGDQVDEIYFVVSGTIKAEFEHEDELFISEFATTGDILGLDGVDSRTHANSCTAISDVALLCLPYPTFILYSQKYEQFNATMLRKIGERINHKKILVEVLARANAESKVAFLLIYLSIKIGGVNGPARVIDPGISRYDMASHLGLAYETLVRTLGNFRSHQFVSFQGRNITIENPLALQNLCSAYIRRMM